MLQVLQDLPIDLTQTKETLTLPRLLQSVIYNSYKENMKLCLVKYLLLYLERRKLLFNNEVKKLVISYGKPHRVVGSDILSRWTKDELKYKELIQMFLQRIAVGRHR